ncbi:class IIb bacteriocin, lactobin A/cerein 7B family [Carboxylicivirga marina]|uniref:Class IIb bacteriocin, lactobin A/cerein 7B family n=1 Tax=Carboxylicivirga marina TaxID=2800988 RepID=A0ABS1HEJ6_9BACT|nr:class IIb bacteriocin, lactobin A/cerein 7B family [Carboxylicivirga marina]MBK3515977.1 class IIb bacteriocin, lactobin A/cerein 7B family [Carboxylicivirga marina]
MKNLNELGVQEMDAKEIKIIDGGIIPLLVVAAVGWGGFALRSAAVGAVAGMFRERTGDSYERGYEAGNN